jgi:hypothetical protein
LFTCSRPTIVVLVIAGRRGPYRRRARPHGAEDALQRAERDYSDGKITAGKWNRFDAKLTAERDAAAAAVKRHEERMTSVMPDVEEGTLRRLSALRDAVLGKLDAAPDLEAVRNVLRQIFKRVVLVDVRGKYGLYPDVRLEYLSDHDHWLEHGQLSEEPSEEPFKRVALPLAECDYSGFGA